MTRLSILAVVLMLGYAAPAVSGEGTCGTFAPDVLYAAGDLPNSVAIGDLDGEFDLDLVVTNSFSDNVSVLLNQCTTPPCPWDCGGDNDGDVGIVDFLALLAQWGGPGACDLDGGGVGITDFLELLGNWGPCP